MSFDLYYIYMLSLFPAAAALVCFIFILLHANRSDRIKTADRKVLLIYFALAFFCWIYWLSRRVGQDMSELGLSFGYALNLLMPLLFCHVVYRLTSGSDKFPVSVHYSIAAAIILFVFAADALYSSVEGRGVSGIAGRAAKAYYGVRTAIGGVYRLTYVALALYRLIRRRESLLSKFGGKTGYAKYTVILMCLFTLMLLFMPTGRYEIYDFPEVLAVLLGVLAVVKYIYLSYKWMYYSALPSPPPVRDDDPPPADTKYMIDQQKFEYYINTQKPFLNPRLRIEDVARGLNTNRTYVSTFINETYGMNFSAYMNSRRIDEFDWLMADPGNSPLSKHDLAIKAGFGSYRNSTRVRKALQMEEKPRK